MSIAITFATEYTDKSNNSGLSGRYTLADQKEILAMPVLIECKLLGGITGNLSGDRENPIPGSKTMSDIKKLRCAGETLADHFRHHMPEVRVEVELAVLDPVTAQKKKTRVCWPLGGALLGEGRHRDEPSAFIESLTRKNLIIAVRGCSESLHTGGRDTQPSDLDSRHPLLATALELAFLGRAADLVKAQDSVSLECDFEQMRERLVSDASPVEVAHGDTPLLLQADMSDEDALRPAFPPMQNRGVSSEITRKELMEMCTNAIDRVVEFVRVLSKQPDFKKKMEAQLEAHRIQLEQAIIILEKRAERLKSTWMGIAWVVDAAARQNTTVVTMDLPVAQLLATGKGKIPMADVDGKSFQELAFAELVVPWTAVDLTSSVSTVVLAEPVQSIDSLRTVGEFAAAQRTMVVATLETQNIHDLQKLLETKPFVKDSEVWKRHVRVVGSNVTVPDLHGNPIVISGAAALVAREIQLKSEKAKDTDFSGEISRAAASFLVPLICQDSAFPHATPMEFITDTMLRETHAKNIVTLLYYHETGKRLFASDAETLYLSEYPDEAAYQFATSTQLANWVSRSVKNHVKMRYDGQVGTPEMKRQLEADVKEWVKKLGRRKILDEKHTSVEVRLKGGVADIVIRIGMPNLINATEVAVMPIELTAEA